MNRKETVLVTGGTGFVGMHILFQLLQKDYSVRTTIRDKASIDGILQTLKDNDITNLEGLSFYEADLTNDKNWEKAIKGCTYIMSVAAPVFFDRPKNEEEAMGLARDGILRILELAKKEGVKRVIMTSNFGAVGFTQTDRTRPTTEEDWTNTEHRAISVYEKSKTMAEKAAWAFIKKEGGNLEFATINPVAILGPSLNSHVSGSFHLLEALLDGSLKAIPNIPLNIVDVRDVAKLHICAMETVEANGNRFIASADGQISLPQIAELLKKERPEVSLNVSSRTLPSLVLTIASLFNAKARESALLAKINRNVSNQKAKSILKWTPMATQEETILAAVDSMKKYNLIKG